MATLSDSVIRTLNGLIETCKDGEQGFRQAAEAIDRQDVKSLFLDYSQERARFAAELQAEVRRLGGDPEHGGSMSGALHRGWINLKSAVTGKSAHPVISAAETGEDSAVKEYEDALRNADLPAELRSLIERQYRRVSSVHDQVRRLRDQAAAA